MKHYQTLCILFSLSIVSHIAAQAHQPFDAMKWQLDGFLQMDELVSLGITQQSVLQTNSAGLRWAKNVQPAMGVITGGEPKGWKYYGSQMLVGTATGSISILGAYVLTMPQIDVFGSIYDTAKRPAVAQAEIIAVAAGAIGTAIGVQYVGKRYGHQGSIGKAILGSFAGILAGMALYEAFQVPIAHGEGWTPFIIGFGLSLPSLGAVIGYNMPTRASRQISTPG